MAGDVDIGLGEVFKGAWDRVGKAVTNAKAPLATAAKVGGTAAGEFTKSAKRYRKDLDEQYRKMQEGQLGYSDAERNQIAYQNAAQNLAQGQAQQAQATGTFANLGATGRTGAYTQAMNALSAQQGAAVAQAGAAADAASSAQAQTAAENVRQRLLAQYQHSAKVWRQTGEDVAEGIMGGDAAEAEAKKKEQDDKEVNDALDKNAGGTAQSKTFTK